MKTEQETLCDLYQQINVLKHKRRAIILAHYYQPAEIQEVADEIGDSLALAKKAAASEAEVIVFCGVSFMAESAAILSTGKTVLLPEAAAGCPLADMEGVEALRAKKREFPDAVVVSYINSTAAVKAESDYCCTSANAVQVVKSIAPEKKIIFGPDCNLGHYVARITGRELILADGYCYVHRHLTLNKIRKLQSKFPGAKLLVHPECDPEVTVLADAVLSTGGMFDYVEKSSCESFIIGTEEGVLYQLKLRFPHKKFYTTESPMHCKDMKATDLLKVKNSLEKLTPCVSVEPEIREAAALALERMLTIF